VRATAYFLIACWAAVVVAYGLKALGNTSGILTGAIGFAFGSASLLVALAHDDRWGPVKP